MEHAFTQERLEIAEQSSANVCFASSKRTSPDPARYVCFVANRSKISQDGVRPIELIFTNVIVD
jgi:hypothetical protein